MKFRYIVSICYSLAAWNTGFAQTSPECNDTYDLVVYGGTASGVVTSVAAAREGSKVLLLEPRNNIGGMVSGGLGATDHGNKKCIGGYALEFYRRTGKHYGEPLGWYPEPKVAEKILNDMLAEAGVTVLKHHRLKENDGVVTSGTRIISIETENGKRFCGKVFADCTYEGDLMAKSGVKYFVGREGMDQYGESLAGVREKTPKHQFAVKVDARDKDGNLLPMIHDKPKGNTGAADKKVQAYNFRLCMTTNPLNMVAFPKPKNYDPKRFQLLANMIKAWEEQKGAAPTVEQLMHPFPIKNGKTDTNNNGAISTNNVNHNWNYPDGSYAEKEKIWQDHVDYVQGFLYFLANDPQVPQKLRDEMNTWGLAKDEFVDNGNWPHQLYIREGRRMVGEYVMTQHDIQTSRTKTDSIGMGSYNSDSHNVQRFVNENGHAENEGDMQVSVKPYEISFKIILPKKNEVQNLVVPVCFSASHVAYSTLRMEPQYMLIGQAAGLTAHMAAKNGIAVQEIDILALQQRLKDQKAVLSLPEYH